MWKVPVNEQNAECPKVKIDLSLLKLKLQVASQLPIVHQESANIIQRFQGGGCDSAV